MGCILTNQAMEHFKSQVFLILSMVTAGECIAYGELARQAGFPGYARQVGRLLKHLPNDTRLPWHRVVNSQKRISFAEGSDAYLKQRAKLEKEGWLIVGNKLIVNESSK